MHQKAKRSFLTAGIFLAVFVVFTILVRFVNVAAIGPENSSVGLSAFNGAVHTALGGYHGSFYTVSKILGYLLIAAAVCIALIAVLQLVSARSLQGVDWDMKVFICYGIIVLIVYIVTSRVSINYRPVILDVTEGLEKSYPSSHTLLAVTVTAALAAELRMRVKDRGLRRILTAAAWAVGAAAVLARLLSGVHWLTDIIGAVLLGAALASTFIGAVKYRYDWF